MFHTKNTPNQAYPNNQDSTQPANPDGLNDFTRSYVPEDEGSGYFLGYMSIVFGLLFNVIGIVLGAISIVRGFKRDKIILSLLGVAGIIVGLFSIWLYIQAFQLILPGVTYDREKGGWIAQQDETSEVEIIRNDYQIQTPSGQLFGLSLPTGLERASTADGAEHDFFITEQSQVDAIGDFKATTLFFQEFDEALMPSELRDLTTSVIEQDQSTVESASFGLLRDTHRGIVPDTIEVTRSTQRSDITHSHFEEVLSFHVAFDRLLDNQVVPTTATVWLLYDSEQIVLLSVSSSQMDRASLESFATETVESFTPR